MKVKRIVANLAATDVARANAFTATSSRVAMDLGCVVACESRAKISVQLSALVDEPWGVRRCYVRDPLGKLVNILQHTG